MSPRKKSRRTDKKGQDRRAKTNQSLHSTIPETDWSRTGAHNVAGVTFQVAVTAGLIVAARARELPLTRVTPEGYEDIDLEFSDETRGLVQVKERSPTARFGRSDFATELRAKRNILSDPDCRFVLATNSALGGGLLETGWVRSLSECLADDARCRLVEQLAGSFEDPCEILTRCHLIRVEWDVVEKSRAELARTLNIHSSVAALAYSRLLEVITGVAVRQRSATPESAEWTAPSDLDALAKRVLETVDVASLDEAVHQGLIEPVDFSVRSDMSVEEFLAGVDVMPAHIAAGLDLPRPEEAKAVADALQKHHSALLVGPSGTGKSALLWRVARELAGRVRPYRLLRLLPDDIPCISRWIRLQEPSMNSPLLICADNLGRRANEGWTAFAKEFIDSPGVLLLGACREEDHRPDLAVGRTTIIDPKLDRALAVSIGGTLAERRVQTTLDVSEAFDASEGLLMEFLSLLMTGRRLRQVVEQQVHDRLNEDRATERDILRCVATAHSVGVAIPAEVLEALIPGKDLAPALALLDREHILAADSGNNWRGLHELRSAVASDYVHRFPPPTMTATIRRLIECLSTEDASRLVELYARSDVDLVPAATAISDILRSEPFSAENGERLVRALAMADAYRHARMCLRVIEENRPSNLDPETVLNLTYAHRFAGVSFDSLIDVNPGFALLVRLAGLLPDRPPSLREIGVQDLSSDQVLAIALRATPHLAVAWLESLEGSGAAGNVPIQDVAEHFGDAPLAVVASLAATLRECSGVEGTANYNDALGDFSHRMRRLASGLPDCIDISSKDECDGRVVSVKLLAPWGDARLNDRSVEVCRLIFDLLPEADIAETIVVTPDDDRFAIGGYDEGHKRIPRKNLPRPRRVADNANILRAGSLLLASRYWTEPVRLLAGTSDKLLRLRSDALSWLINPHHNRGRRRATVKDLTSLIAYLARGSGLPMADDDLGERNSAMEAMREAVSVIRDVAVAESPDFRDSGNLGTRCRSAVGRLMEARKGNLPGLSTVGDPLPEALDEMLTLLAEVLIARAEQRKVPSHLLHRARSESWVDVAHRSMSAVAASGYQAEREALQDAFGMPNPTWEVHRIENRNLKSPHSFTDWWVLVIPLEGDLPDLAAFLDRLDPGMAERLAFRTYLVLGAAGGSILPVCALTLGGSQWLPAGDDDLLKIGNGLHAEVFRSTQLQAWDAFVGELIQASRAASLFLLREQAALAGDQRAFDGQFAAALSAAKACHPSLQAQANRLAGRVESELHGEGQGLAGEFYRLVVHGEQGDDVAAHTDCRFQALLIDLKGGVSGDLEYVRASQP